MNGIEEIEQESNFSDFKRAAMNKGSVIFDKQSTYSNSNSLLST